MNPELVLKLMEDICSELPADMKAKVHSTRAALHKMIELDPECVPIAITLVTVELGVKARKKEPGRPSPFFPL